MDPPYPKILLNATKTILSQLHTNAMVSAGENESRNQVGNWKWPIKPNPTRNPFIYQESIHLPIHMLSSLLKHLYECIIYKRSTLGACCASLVPNKILFYYPACTNTLACRHAYVCFARADNVHSKTANAIGVVLYKNV